MRTASAEHMDGRLELICWDDLLVELGSTHSAPAMQAIIMKSPLLVVT